MTENNKKNLEILTNQYNAVVKQNQSLQKVILWQQDQMQKDQEYLVKLEEANMLYEQDIEALKRQVEALQDRLNDYKNTITEIKKLVNVV